MPKRSEALIVLRRRSRLRILLYLAMATLPGLGAHASVANQQTEAQVPKGAGSMTENQLIEALRDLDPNQQPALDALVQKVVLSSRALPRAAVAHLDDPNRKVSDNALSVVTEIGELATVPLLEAHEPPSPYDRVARMTLVVDGQLELREQIVTHLKKMLDDKAAVAYNRTLPAEQEPPPSRVCDEAYVLLRRLLNSSEGEDEQLANTRFFLRLPEHRKDAEISKARVGKPWTKLTEGEE